MLLLTIILLSAIFPTSAAEKHQNAEVFFPDSGAPEAMRERLANRILGRYRRLDPEFDDYYQQVLSLLSPNDNYLVINAKDSSTNAFAHFGGFIVIMDGMVLFSQSEDELLGIISHEIGHIKNNHFTRQKEKNKTTSALSIPLLIAGVLSDDPEVKQALIIGSSGFLSSEIYAYTRSLEHEADVFALNLMGQAGRNRHALGEAFHRLHNQGYNEYVSTHPESLRRSSYLKDRLRGQKIVPVENSLSFLLLKEKIIVDQSVNKNTQKIINAEGDKKIAAQYGLLLQATKTRNKTLAEETREALSHTKHPFILAAIAESLSRFGDIKQALEIYQKAHKDYPQSATLSLGLIKTLIRNKRQKEVIALHNKMPENIKNRPDILKQVAIAVEEKPALSNLLLAKGHFYSGAFKQTLRQISIAEKYKGEPKILLEILEIKEMAKKELHLINNRKL